ncbi:Succinyl-CoA--L-malate CoA-transferase beta subunit [bacterium HR24]|jgi:crotonobetainyl-CoA:carnitine CoA-transferase CaiB-like acyl-CoA transferase|nr:Succinyl-CoA--L-malate CoA-transferase beta subunit [bacterium HR24]
MMALEGIRILDMAHLPPARYGTMLLADFGADVICIEQPPGASRLGDVDGSDRARVFNPLNRNKRFICLNLKDEEGRQAFYRLVETADVLVEGFRPGVTKRLGADYETLRQINPRLIYTSLSGYGQDGPYASLVGHDINYISIGGALGMIGWPGQPPAIPVNIIADFAGGGLHMAFSILLALQARQRTGRGQYVDVAMTDGVLSLISWLASFYLGEGNVIRPGQEFLNGGTPFYNVYETADGRWISIGCVEGWFWENLCRALGFEEYIPHQWSKERYPEIFENFRRRFKERTREEWFQYLSQHEVCVGPVYSLDEVFEDPQVRHRRMVLELEHPQMGRVRHVGIGPKLSETPGSVRSVEVQRGQHTDQLLSELGYSAEEVRRLRERGAVA